MERELGFRFWEILEYGIACFRRGGEGRGGEGKRVKGDSWVFFEVDLLFELLALSFVDLS